MSFGIHFVIFNFVFFSRNITDAQRGRKTRSGIGRTRKREEE
jgi:hypothetical protein